jgi:uncharacterized membrane protein YkvA (DUF1232 family)
MTSRYRHYSEDELDILEASLEDQVEDQSQTVKNRFWKTLQRAAGQIPFIEDIVAGYYCALDKQTPLRVRATLLAALAYFVMPVDAIPDFIAGLGFTDDISVLMMVMNVMRSSMTPDHRLAAKNALGKHLDKGSTANTETA